MTRCSLRTHLVSRWSVCDWCVNVVSLSYVWLGVHYGHNQARLGCGHWSVCSQSIFSVWSVSVHWPIRLWDCHHVCRDCSLWTHSCKVSGHSVVSVLILDTKSHTRFRVMYWMNGRAKCLHTSIQDHNHYLNHNTEHNSKNNRRWKQIKEDE